MKTGKLWREGRSKVSYAWVAAAILIAVLVSGPFGALPGSVASAQEDVREEPFPEIGGAISVGLVVARESDREEPFPEVEGPIVASIQVWGATGMRYTDLSAFYVERLRAQIAQDSKPYTAVAAFYAERRRAEIARDLRLAADPLLGALGIDLDRDTWIAGGNTCATC